MAFRKGQEVFKFEIDLCSEKIVGWLGYFSDPPTKDDVLIALNQEMDVATTPPAIGRLATCIQVLELWDGDPNVRKIMFAGVCVGDLVLSFSQPIPLYRKLKPEQE